MSMASNKKFPRAEGHLTAESLAMRVLYEDNGGHVFVKTSHSTAICLYSATVNLIVGEVYCIENFEPPYVESQHSIHLINVGLKK